MEEHFLNEIASGLCRPETVSRKPWYNPHGDCIVYQTVDEAVVADRIDEFLTIYRSASDGRAVGFQIKEVMALIRIFGYDTLRVQARLEGDKLISLRALWLAAYEQSASSIQRRIAYASLPMPDPGMDSVLIAPVPEEVCVAG